MIDFPKSITRALAIALAAFCIAIAVPLNAETPPSFYDYLRVGDYAGAVGSIEKEWQFEYQDYFNRVRTAAATDIDRIAATLDRLSQETGQNSALIHLCANPEQLELFLILPDRSLIHRSAPYSQLDRLSAMVQTFSDRLQNPFRLASKEEYLPLAEELYRTLVAPIEAELEAAEIETLLVCLSAKLRSLPLAALYDGEQFLIEKYSLTRIPSFNLISTEYRPLTDAAVLAMGASEFASQAPLPAVPIEIEAIASTPQDRAFLNRDFTFANLKKFLTSSDRYPIVHLATHAEFLPGDPDRSYIQLWDDRLTLDRLPELNWQDAEVSLLVLSACQTALGSREAELGFAGLAYQAGVDAAIASLWSVSDVGTLALMKEFYRQLRLAPTKAEALRQAQIAMIRGEVRIEGGQLQGTATSEVLLPDEIATPGTFAHPFFWAAFSAIGSPW